MRAASNILIGYLAAKKPFFSADLFTLTLYDGTVYNWTSADQPVTYNGVQWAAVGPVLTRTNWEVKNTTDVPNMTVKLLSTGTDFNGGENIKLAIHNGLLDGATFTLHRAVMPTWGDTSLGIVLLFQGQVSGVSITALGATLTIKGANVLLQQYAPRNEYAGNCLHALYDANCTLNRTDFQSTQTVVSADRVTVNWTGSGPANPSYYFGGTVQFTSGVADGQIRSIMAINSVGLQVAYPLYEAPAVGDTFVITQGCNRTLTRCAQFGNTQHFRGFLFIPPAETAM